MQRNDGDYVKTLIKKKKSQCQNRQGHNTPLRKKANHTVTHTHVTYTHPLIQTKSQHPCTTHPPTHPPQPIPSRVESP